MSKRQLIDYLKNQGFPEKILEAFKKIKRENFVSKEHKEHVYQDYPIPIGYGATISQPYTIAFMLDLLELKPKSKQKVLEIGSGSGYVLALINEITKSKTYGVEIIKELAQRSQQTLRSNKDIIIVNSNGKKGLPKHAPYDGILVSASVKDKEIIDLLAEQLKEKGILVASFKNSVIKIEKQKGRTKKQEFYGFVFVPLID